MVKNLEKLDFEKLLKSLGSFLSPILYLFVWYFFLKISLESIPLAESQQGMFLILSFLIFIFGFVVKSTSWSIGHDKFGIKGDSRARIINFHRNDSGDSWFDLFADNSELLKDEKIRDLIKELTSKDKE